MTVYIKIVPDGQKFEYIEWMPWINCDPSDKLLPRLALNKWIRERGGIGENERLTVNLYHYNDETPRHANGKPKQCQNITYTINGSAAA